MNVDPILWDAEMQSLTGYLTLSMSFCVRDLFASKTTILILLIKKYKIYYSNANIVEREAKIDEFVKKC